MGLKILHSADWHLDSPFAGYPEEQRQLLKAEQKKIPGKILELCRREKCDMMLLAGDIFDGKANYDSVELLKKMLKDTGIPVLVAPGNHDFCGAGSPWVEESWPENVFVFTGGLESVTIAGLNCRIYGAGYRSMDCEGLLKDFRAEGDERYCIGVLHGDPTRKDSPNCPITVAQVRDSGLDYLALGHIHKAGAFQAGSTLCAWPGCPMGRGWDETGEKGVCIVTLEDTAQIRAVSLETLRFYDLEVNVEDHSPEAVLPAAPSRDFYRVTLTGSGKVDLTEIRERFSHLPNLQLRDETREPLDLWGSCGSDTLEGTYFRLLREKLETDPETAQLAAEISRKILTGREVKL